MVAATTVCAGSPIPFDATEVDRKLAAERTLGGLAETANRVVFDLYDHCALVVRFFVVEKGSGPRLVKVSGDRRLVPNRVALRGRALKTGQQAATTLGGSRANWSIPHKHRRQRAIESEATRIHGCDVAAVAGRPNP